MADKPTLKMTKPKCKSCGSGQVYILIDKTLVCRLCGNRETKKKDK